MTVEELKLIRLEITVAGTPAARPRPRARAFQIKPGKWVGRMYQPKKPSRRGTKADKAWAKANAWYEAVLLAARPDLPREPWTGPVMLTADVFFERPKYMLTKRWPDGPIRHTAKPDRDNLDKPILDALKVAGLFKDDCQVCDGPVRKWYAARGHGPGVILVAELLAESEEILC